MPPLTVSAVLDVSLKMMRLDKVGELHRRQGARNDGEAWRHFGKVGKILDDAKLHSASAIL